MKKKAIEFFSRSALPILMTSVIARMIIKCYYFEMTAPLTVLFAVMSVGCFMLFDLIKKRRFLGMLVYLALFSLMMFLGSRLMSAGWYNTFITFTDWFYLNRDTAGFNIYYFFMMYLSGGFFLISIVYYFTRVRFRATGLMLCLLFPFVIYAKRADIMNGYEVTVIVTVFLAILVHNRLRENKPAEVRAVNDIAYIVTVAVFVSAAGAFAMLIPKPEVKSVLERDSHAFDITPLNNSKNTYSRYSASSSARYGASYTGEILFYCESDYLKDVYYLKRQAYDNFYGDTWHNDRGSEKYTTFDYYSGMNIDRNTYYNSLKALADTGRYKQYGLDPSVFTLGEFTDSSFRVFDERFKGVYVPTPSGVIAKTFSESLSDPYYMYGDGEIMVKKVEADYDYTVRYYPETDNYVNYASKLAMDGDSYYTMLMSAAENGDLTNTALITQYQKAAEYYTGGVETSPRIAELARSIVKGKVSDYDKAKALEVYYENAGFIYDVDFEPDDTSLEAFLFDHKTGSCTSYATAMTIMARVVGLPARYVEGFAAYEKTDSGSIAVRDSHAHAYVEVFVAGAGWLVFDPTVPGYMSEGTGGGGGFSISSIAEYFSRVFVLLGVGLFVFIVIMFDRVIELAFRIRMRFVKGDARIIKLYARVIKLLEFSGGDELRSYTAKMLTDYAREHNNADITPIARLFERTCFGSIPLEDGAFGEAYRHYKGIYKYLRKRPKRQDIVSGDAVQEAR